MTYSWVMRQVVLPQAHLIAGLKLPSAKVVTVSMAAPLHNSPLIFQLLDAEIPHLRKIEFTILPAITLHNKTVQIR